LKGLLRKKGKGEKIEPVREPRSDNVVNLMDALRSGCAKQSKDVEEG
jgi:non-homologous end joining protein Ku